MNENKNIKSTKAESLHASTIAGSMNEKLKMDSTRAGSINDKINMESTIA